MKKFKIHLNNVFYNNNNNSSDNIYIIKIHDFNNGKLLFNNKNNDYFITENNNIKILQDIEIIIGLNIFIKYISNDEYSYYISKLTIKINDNIIHQKKYGFDAMNTIKDNILLSLKKNDIITIICDKDVEKTSFLYISLV
jgi:hypothetical protein